MLHRPKNGFWDLRDSAVPRLSTPRSSDYDSHQDILGHLLRTPGAYSCGFGGPETWLFIHAEREIRHVPWRMGSLARIAIAEDTA